jgi:hypothetical protein
MFRLRAVLGQPVRHGTRRLLLFTLLDFNQFRPRLVPNHGDFSTGPPDVQKSTRNPVTRDETRKIAANIAKEFGPPKIARSRGQSGSIRYWPKTTRLTRCRHQPL